MELRNAQRRPVCYRSTRKWHTGWARTQCPVLACEPTHSKDGTRTNGSFLLTTANDDRVGSVTIVDSLSFRFDSTPMSVPGCQRMLRIDRILLFNRRVFAKWERANAHLYIIECLALADQRIHNWFVSARRRRSWFISTGDYKGCSRERSSNPWDWSMKGISL